MSIFDSIKNLINTVHDAVRPSPIATHAAWDGGWYTDAIRKPAHPGRVGGPIKAWSIVLHTTDCLPTSLPGILNRWQNEKGEGDCAHFMIDLDGTCYQLVSITRNANHVGGTTHGWFANAAGTLIHGNSVSIGIEMHCTGHVVQRSGLWYLKDGTQMFQVSASLVTPDPAHPGNGWVYPTQAQLDKASKLTLDLNAVLGPVPAGTRIVPNGVPNKWAIMDSCRAIGHTSIDPNNRSDPGPRGLEVLRGLLL